MKRRNFLQLLAASAAGAALTMSSAEAKNTGRRVRISAGNRTWYATLDDNATARALIAHLRHLAQQQGLALDTALPPPPPEPTTCCERGCNGCVWEGFYAALDHWRADALALLRGPAQP